MIFFPKFLLQFKDLIEKKNLGNFFSKEILINTFFFVCKMHVPQNWQAIWDGGWGKWIIFLSFGVQEWHANRVLNWSYFFYKFEYAWIQGLDCAMTYCAPSYRLHPMKHMMELRRAMKAQGMKFLLCLPITPPRKTYTLLLGVRYPCSHLLEGFQTLMLLITKSELAYIHTCPFLSCLWLRSYTILVGVSCY